MKAVNDTKKVNSNGVKKQLYIAIIDIVENYLLAANTLAYCSEV
jgi:hypothetical protein